MSAKSDNKDAAWTFLQWLQSAERRREAVHGARRDLPCARNPSANSPVFMTDQPPANKKAIMTEAKASGVGGFGYFPEWDELEGTIINPAPGQDLGR